MNNMYEKKGKSKFLMFIVNGLLAIVTAVVVFVTINML